MVNYIKFKIVKARIPEVCWGCHSGKGANNYIEKGDIAVSISNYKRCCACGKDFLLKQRALFALQIDQINDALHLMETKYQNQIVVQRLR